MATGRPIVSTPIEDVVSQFSDVVEISGSPEEFLAICARAADSPNLLRIQRGLEIAENSSWDSIVDQLDEHVLDIVTRKRSVATDAA